MGELAADQTATVASGHVSLDLTAETPMVVEPTEEPTAEPTEEVMPTGEVMPTEEVMPMPGAHP